MWTLLRLYIYYRVLYPLWSVEILTVISVRAEFGYYFTKSYQSPEEEVINLLAKAF